MVQAEVVNTGGRAIDLSGSLVLADGPGGLRAGPFKVHTPTTLAPGQRGRVSVPMDKRVPDGPWHARMTLRSGLVKDSVSATISFPAAGETASFAVDKSWWHRLGWVPVGVAVGAFTLLGLVLARRRRHHPEVVAS